MAALDRAEPLANPTRERTWLRVPGSYDAVSIKSGKKACDHKGGGCTVRNYLPCGFFKVILQQDVSNYVKWTCEGDEEPG